MSLIQLIINYVIKTLKFVGVEKEAKVSQNTVNKYYIQMAKKSESILTMNRDLNRVFTLVESTFTSDEAREVLMSLIKSKLTFHNLKNLRSFEQTGAANYKSEERIEQLEEMREEILDLLRYAGKTGQKLKINSQINVELVEFAEKAPIE